MGDNTTSESPTTGQDTGTDNGANEPAGTSGASAQESPQGSPYRSSREGFTEFLQKQESADEVQGEQVADGNDVQTNAGAAAGTDAAASTAGGGAASGTPVVAQTANEAVIVELRRQNELLQRQVAAHAKPAVKEEPPAPIVEPWELSGEALGIDGARRVLGDVSEATLSKYASTQSLISQWEKYADHVEYGTQAKREIASGRAILRQLTDSEKGDRDIRERLARLENGPKRAQHLQEQCVHVVEAILTTNIMARAGYPVLSKMAADGSFDVDIALDGIDLADIDVSKPQTLTALDTRLAFLEKVYAGAPEPAGTAPAESVAKVKGPVKVQNPAGILPAPNSNVETQKRQPVYQSERDHAEGFSEFLKQREANGLVRRGPIHQNGILPRN